MLIPQAIIPDNGKNYLEGGGEGGGEQKTYVSLRRMHHAYVHLCKF